MYDHAVPVHIPVGVYVFYVCLQHHYLSEAALLHQWLSWAGQYLTHYSKRNVMSKEVQGKYFQSNYILQCASIVLYVIQRF